MQNIKTPTIGNSLSPQTYLQRLSESNGQLYLAVCRLTSLQSRLHNCPLQAAEDPPVPGSFEDELCRAMLLSSTILSDLEKLEVIA